MASKDTVSFRGALNPPAPPEVIDGLRAETGVALPDGYLDFLREHDGGHGEVGENMLILWRAEDLTPLNRDYEVAEMIPDLFLFGSDGGGLAYAFDLRPGANMAVVNVEFVGLDWGYVTLVASNFGNMWWALNGGERDPLEAELGDAPQVEEPGEAEAAEENDSAPSPPPRGGWLTRLFRAMRQPPAAVHEAVREVVPEPPMTASYFEEPLEIHMITPLIFGGDPVDPANKVLLSRAQHVDAVRYWNKVIRDMKRDGKWPGTTGGA